MENDLSQQTSAWAKFWEGNSPFSEIQKWDFYGGRQWITKYVPRFGKVVEAGCGFGRYVFYLKKFGIDIEGIDFTEEVIEKLNHIKREIEPSAKFACGDVTKLPYEDNMLSGYISLGVVEHFIEGPHRAIAEAHRVLRPGGIAIITTPNRSFYHRYKKPMRFIKTQIKKIIGRKIPFFQYEYSPRQLKNFVQKQGLHVSRAEGCDWLYVFNAITKFNAKRIEPGTFAYKASRYLENSWLRYFGGQTVTISVRKAPLMHCFLSGELSATPDSLLEFDVPISREMQGTELAKLYRKGRKVKWSCDYVINPPYLQPKTRVCDFSGTEYLTDPVFEDFGFNKNVCPGCLYKPEINISLSVNNNKPIWRNNLKH